MKNNTKIFITIICYRYMTKHKKLLDINIQIRVRKILVNNIQLNKENLFGNIIILWLEYEKIINKNIYY